MDLLKIFKSDRDGIRKSHVKNLIAVAMADGYLDETEWGLLSSIGRVLGMTEDEIGRIKEHPDSVKFIPPRSYEEKVEQICDLVALMTVDDEINTRELELVRKIALKLDILPQMVDMILQDIYPPRAR